MGTENHTSEIADAKELAFTLGESTHFMKSLISLYTIRNAILVGDSSEDLLELIDLKTNSNIGGANVSQQLIGDKEYSKHVLTWLRKTLEIRRKTPTKASQEYEEHLVRIISELESN